MDQPPSEPASVVPTPGEPEWRRWLSGASPREVLARLVEGDPLHLRERCESRLQAQALLVDPHRLHLRVVAHIARNARGYSGSPPLDVWVAEFLRKSLRELNQESTEMIAAGETLPTPQAAGLLSLGRSLGIDPALFGRACAEFNRQPYEVRAAFLGLVMKGDDPVEWCRANSTTPERARAALRSALWALGVRDDLDLGAWLSEGDDDE